MENLLKKINNKFYSRCKSTFKMSLIEGVYTVYFDDIKSKHQYVYASHDIKDVQEFLISMSKILEIVNDNFPICMCASLEGGSKSKHHESCLSFFKVSNI